MNDGFTAAGDCGVTHGTTLGIEAMCCAQYHQPADKLNEQAPERSHYCTSDRICASRELSAKITVIMIRMKTSAGIKVTKRLVCS